MADQIKKGYLRGVRGLLVTPLNTDGSLPSVVPEVAATANTGVGTSLITWTAKAGMGVSGNSIVVILQNPGANSQALSVTVYLRAILVSLATDGTGVITTTATLLKAAIAASAEASLLVVCSGAGAAGLITDQTAHLVGGTDQQGANYWVNTPEEVGYTAKVEAGAEDTLRGGDAVLTSVKDPDIVKGITLAIRDARFDAKLAEIIDGGTLIEDGGEIIGYTAPTVAAQATPIPFRAKVYVQSYNETGHREAYLAYNFVYCIGKLGNITHTDKAWGSAIFNVDASENPSTLASVYSKEFVDTLPTEAGV
jgi:hypothetical protein